MKGKKEIVESITPQVIEAKSHEVSEIVMFGRELSNREREDISYRVDAESISKGEVLSAFETGFKMGAEYFKTLLTTSTQSNP